MEIIDTDFIFQVNASIVKEAYEKDNFLIQYDEAYILENRCAVYFSSNYIYYPNSENVFRNRILEQDFYEWYGTRVTGVYKHIFVRDIQKQWYLEGISSRINTPELLCEFLRKETISYSVTMLGSSAGGYAAVLYGSLLSVEKVISFNGQFELCSLLKTSNCFVDPVLFKNGNTSLLKYFDLANFIGSNINIFYFSSLYSKWDCQQYYHIKDLGVIKPLFFKTSHHGIPFVKSALKSVINMTNKELLFYENKKLSPVFFSLKFGGVANTINVLIKQITIRMKRVFKKI